MFLHIGNGHALALSDIIAIYDEKTFLLEENRAYIQQIGIHKKISNPGIGEMKSLVITKHGAYLSPISSTTLKRRAASPLPPELMDAGHDADDTRERRRDH